MSSPIEGMPDLGGRYEFDSDGEDKPLTPKHKRSGAIRYPSHDDNVGSHEGEEESDSSDSSMDVDRGDRERRAGAVMRAMMRAAMRAMMRAAMRAMTRSDESDDENNDDSSDEGDNESD